MQSHNPNPQRRTFLLASIAGLLMIGISTAACQANTATQAGALSGVPSGATQAGAAPAAAPTALPTRVVSTSKTVAVDGALALATPLISASFDSSGYVTAVNVKPGQAVKKGDVLAELDGAELKLALEKAQESLALKQAQINNSLTPATASEIASAKAALSAASAAYSELKAGASSHDVEQALRSWNQAKNALYTSQLSRDETCRKKEATCEQANLAVQSAELRERSAYQSYLDAQQPATDQELAQSRSAVLQAQANLAGVQSGATEAQKKAYDLQLKQAQISVDRAQRNLADARLLSPCDCVVQEVGLAAGAPSAGGSITLLDTSTVQFQTSNLTEQDVVKLKAGQAATIRLKAFTQTLSGKIKAVLPLSSGAQGTVSLYTALIDIDPSENQLLPGMTGQAEISLE